MKGWMVLEDFGSHADSTLSLLGESTPTLCLSWVRGQDEGGGGVGVLVAGKLTSIGKESWKKPERLAMLKRCTNAGVKPET